MQALHACVAGWAPGPRARSLFLAGSFTIFGSVRHAMPGPVVNGVKVSHSSAGSSFAQESESTPFLPLLSEGSIRLVLLTSGVMLVARLRQTTDSDGDRAYQLIRPLRLEKQDDSGPWSLHPYLVGLTPQRNVVMLKAAVAAL